MIIGYSDRSLGLDLGIGDLIANDEEPAVLGVAVALGLDHCAAVGLGEGDGHIGESLAAVGVTAEGVVVCLPLSVKGDLFAVMDSGEVILVAALVAVAAAVRLGVPAYEGVAHAGGNAGLDGGVDGVGGVIDRAALAAVCVIVNGVCRSALPLGGIGHILGDACRDCGLPALEVPARTLGAAAECGSGGTGFEIRIDLICKDLLTGNAVGVGHGVKLLPLCGVGGVGIKLCALIVCRLPAGKLIAGADGSALECGSGGAVCDGVALICKSSAVHAIGVGNGALKLKTDLYIVCNNACSIKAVFNYPSFGTLIILPPDEVQSLVSWMGITVNPVADPIVPTGQDGEVGIGIEYISCSGLKFIAALEMEGNSRGVSINIIAFDLTDGVRNTLGMNPRNAAEIFFAAACWESLGSLGNCGNRHFFNSSGRNLLGLILSGSFPLRSVGNGLGCGRCYFRIPAEELEVRAGRSSGEGRCSLAGIYVIRLISESLAAHAVSIGNYQLAGDILPLGNVSSISGNGRSNLSIPAVKLVAVTGRSTYKRGSCIADIHSVALRSERSAAYTVSICNNALAALEVCGKGLISNSNA